jgi:plasmid stabilization system protein ParE
MAGPVDLEWSRDALADLDRFAAFLHEHYPDLAGRVAQQLIARAEVLRRHLLALFIP